MALCVTLPTHKTLGDCLVCLEGSLYAPPTKGEGSYAYSLRVGETYAYLHV